ILFALWHGRMFLPINVHRHTGIGTMASKSRDGEIITRWLENNGYLVTRGSTTRGGSAAFRRLLRQVRSGRNIALTVDGPRGPARDFEINPNMDVTGLTFRLYSTSLRIRPNSFPRPAPGSRFSSIHPRSAGR